MTPSHPRSSVSSYKRSGEDALCGAVIESALGDLRLKDPPRNATALTLRHRIIEQRSAIAFFTRQSSNFHWMVAAVGLDADVVVEAITADLESTERQIIRLMERLGAMPEDIAAIDLYLLRTQRGRGKVPEHSVGQDAVD